MKLKTKPSIDAHEFRDCMLNWYDTHRRDLPWRAKAGHIANPYHVWLSEIMLQQTTVAAVIPYFLKFTYKWPTIEALARAEASEVMQDWAGLGYYARARNLLACAREVVEHHNGTFPSDQQTLETLPGIGHYTSAAISAIAFQKPANVVDGNIERVMARYHAIQDPLPGIKPLLKTLAGGFSSGFEKRPGDYAQALMDLGATICTPKRPLCSLCPLNKNCAAYDLGIASQLPARSIKPEKPKKIGNVFWIEDEKGRILIETRPPKGLLGGMPGLPTSPWVETGIKNAEPEKIKLENTSKAKGKITHIFTHFHLTLHLYKANIESTPPKNTTWINKSEIIPTKFPTVFKKAVQIFLKIH